MSSGFFSFFAHTGFLTVLEDEGLLPTRVSGSSAGALVDRQRGRRGSMRPTSRASSSSSSGAISGIPASAPGSFAGGSSASASSACSPTRAFDACRVPVAVSVFEVRSRRTRVLDERRSRAGDPARRARCRSSFIRCAIDGRAYLDGGILDRPGLAGMPASEPRVLFHHIASKSAWRTKLDVPRRRGMVTVVLEGLPRSGPFRLDAGRRAFRAARAAMKRALDEKTHGRRGDAFADGLLRLSPGRARSHFAVASSAG